MLPEFLTATLQVNVSIGRPFVPDQYEPSPPARPERRPWKCVGKIYPTQAQIPELCRKFIFRICENGRRCPRIHCSKVDEECRHFLEGRCVYGDYCRRLHPSIPGHPAPGSINVRSSKDDSLRRSRHIYRNASYAGTSWRVDALLETTAVGFTLETPTSHIIPPPQSKRHPQAAQSLPAVPTQMTSIPEPSVRLPQRTTLSVPAPAEIPRATSPASSISSRALSDDEGPSNAHPWNEDSDTSWFDTGQSSDGSKSYFSALSQASSSTSSLAPVKVPESSTSAAVARGKRPSTTETGQCSKCLRKECNGGYRCRRRKPTAIKGTTEGGPVTEICRDWCRGRCRKSPCKYRHGPLDGPPDGDASAATPVAEVNTPKATEPSQHVAPPARAPPRVVLHFETNARLDDPVVELPPLPAQAPAQEPAAIPDAAKHVPSMKYTIEEYMTVKLLPGFQVDEIITGFESPTILIDNVPGDVPLKNLSHMLGTYGRVVDVARKPKGTIFVRYAHAADATAASAALDGKDIFGAKAHVRKPVQKGDSRKLTVNDSTVRVDFELPTKVIYAGYENLVQAEIGIATASQGIRDHIPAAEHHKGVPAVGINTVKFVGLPVNVKTDEIRSLGKVIDHMWERPNYKSSVEEATSGLERYFARNGGVTRFALQPPPYVNGVATAWITYSSTAEAKAACVALDGRKPACVGYTRIHARQTFSVLYDVETALYAKQRYPIQRLATFARERGVDMAFVSKDNGLTTQVRMKAHQLQDVVDLRTELERILRGQVLRDHDKVIWHPFFTFPQGHAYIRDLEASLPGVSVMTDVRRHEIRVSGPQAQRREAFGRLRAKIRSLTSQQLRAIPLAGDAIGLYLDPDVVVLRARFGDGGVMLDMEKRALVIRGSETVYNEALMALRRAKQRRYTSVSSDPRVCPVCFVEATNPVTLRCGHNYCRECMHGFLMSSAENKLFPLSCLGDGGRCTECITHYNARAVLNQFELDRLVQAAFTAHVNARPDEFHYCPTPDCKQVYRTVGKGTALQCPACLLRICSSCHSEYHGGLRCNADDGAAEFDEWMKTHGVKRCPGCKVPIERDEGCYHVTCTQCQTHICWQCMETFPGGDGIYGHMRTEHGTFGLGPIED
ncbi:hypothetical protein EV122DRAFT_203473 [Schizophyllum commune]